MPLINSVTRTIEVKIVYYGPGLSGKTTNLRKLKELLAAERTGELMVLDTHGDRTLFFDWMPVDLGKVKGFDVRIQLYTVPGQVRYNNTRKQVLKGVDGVVFVADSQRAAAEQNEFSYENLRENLQEVMGIDIEDIPLVIQCNKQDLGDVMAPRELARLLGAEHRPYIKAIASQGEGVLETLRLITRLTLEHLREFFDPDKVVSGNAGSGALDGDTLLTEILESGTHQKDEETAAGESAVPKSASDEPEFVQEVEVEAIPAGETDFGDGEPEDDGIGADVSSDERMEATPDNDPQEGVMKGPDGVKMSVDDLLARIELLELRLEELDVSEGAESLEERVARLEKRMDIMESEWAEQIYRRIRDLEKKLEKLTSGLAGLAEVLHETDDSP